MPEMVAWLRQTIEGDKAAAEALDGEVWTAVKANGDWHIKTSQDQTFGGDAEWGELDPNEAALIARHDPRDTIARCEAELALLERLEYAMNDPINFDFAARNLAEDGIELLLSGYRHREGFNSEWVNL